MSDLDTDEMLTIAEVAALIGVTDRAVRRRLERPEYAAQTRQVTRRTRTGTRWAAALPPALVEALIQDFTQDFHRELQSKPNVAEHGGEPAEDGGTRRGTVSKDGGTRQVGEPPRLEAAAGITLGQAFEIALHSKDELLSEKDARIAELTGALAHEREQSRRLGESLAREQVLRSLPPPEQALSAPTVVGGSKEAGSWARVKKWFSNM